MTQPESPSRRRLLTLAGASAAVAVPLRRAESRQIVDRYEFLTTDEASFIEAAVARLIPVDELGPGALEARVPRFIDRQLAGAFGAGARLYRAGPWRKGEPTQGYQLPHTPAELVRLAVRAIRADLGPNRFEKLDSHAQDRYLDRLHRGDVDLGAAGTSEFFDLLLALTMEGYFSDPVYGGNHDMQAWRMIGFPGAYSNYYDLVGENVAFRAAPTSIAEARQAHGK